MRAMSLRYPFLSELRQRRGLLHDLTVVHRLRLDDMHQN